MKWPSDLDFGEEVLVIRRDYVRNADDDTLDLESGNLYEATDSDLIGVFRIPE